MKERRSVRGGSLHANWKGHGQIPLDYWNNLYKASALKDGKEWSITIEFMDSLLRKQDNACALSGLTISLGDRRNRTASIDRIDSNKGYTEDNVQWVHKDVNTMKTNFDQKYFLALCKAIDWQQHNT